MARNTEQYKKMLFIGSGNIASAVACGLVSSKTVPAEFITVYNRNSNKFAKFQKLGINTTLDIKTALDGVRYVFIAVKPNVVGEVMELLSKEDLNLKDKVIVSLAASVPCSFIEAKAGMPLKIIRTMPSTPITIGEGVLAVSSYGDVSAKELQLFCRMMSSIAYVTVIDESLMNPIISVQGSSPAYVYLFIKAMLDASVKQGIDRNVALPLILKTIKGAVSMVEKCDLPIETLISNVASPNGTTLKALNSFEKDDFCGAVERAMNACTERANEISEEL